MWKIKVASEKETQEVVYKLTKNLSLPFLLILKGDLGAGKTYLSQAVLKSYGYNDFQGSPTFSILNTYESSTPSLDAQNSKSIFFHFDLYRISDSVEFANLGFAEIIAQTNPLNLKDDTKEKVAVLLEWAERIEESLPQWSISININKITNLAADSEQVKQSLESFFNTDTVIDLSNINTEREIVINIPNLYYPNLVQNLKRDSYFKKYFLA